MPVYDGFKGIVQQIWNGLPADRQALTGGLLMAGSPFHSSGLTPIQQAALPAPGPSVRKPPSSRLERAKWVIKRLPWEERGTGVNRYYRSVPCETVVEAFGWLNPVLNGRPKDFAQMLLNGLPSPCSGKGYRWMELGLVYFTPPIIGHRRSWNRTTAAGLALLKHWNEKFPKFRPFFQAYYDAKTEDQIMLDCVDFTLGRMPYWFEAVLAKNKEIEKKREEKARETSLAAAIHQSRQLNQQLIGGGALSQASLHQSYAERMQQNILNQQTLFGQQQLQQREQQMMQAYHGMQPRYVLKDQGIL